MKLRILLVDDHRIVLEGLRLLISKHLDLEVVGVAFDGATALELVRQRRPDVVVMDISMPGMNGIEATRRIVVELPATRVLALSMESERRFVVDVLKAGAQGYLLKDCAQEELVSAIRLVAAGEPYLGPRITAMIIRDYMERVPDEAALTHAILSPREREVLQLIADGKSTKEIAFTFGVSLKTIETQRHSVMKKLNLYSIAELTKYALREGLTSLR